MSTAGLYRSSICSVDLSELINRYTSSCTSNMVKVKSTRYVTLLHPPSLKYQTLGLEIACRFVEITAVCLLFVGQFYKTLILAETSFLVVNKFIC